MPPLARLPLVCGRFVRLHELPYRLALIPLSGAYFGPEAMALLVLLVLEGLRRPFAPSRWPEQLCLNQPVRPWLTPRLILFSATALPGQKATRQRRLRVHLFADQLRPTDYARLRRLLLRLARGDAADTAAARTALRFHEL